MTEIKIPEKVNIVLSRLAGCGFEGFVVGGCVRDSLMGRPVNDWDICTSAAAEEVKSAFSDMTVIDTGIRHGTVTVFIDGEGFEITTYRIDGDYIDGRHPESVSFTKSLEEDLARRDFSVNAMAYNSERGLVDLFGGKDDIASGVIRCVGDPEKRFGEDALRIIRAIRFSSTLGFEIEASTSKAMRDLKDRLSLVSVERISQEFNKMLLGDSINRVLLEYSDIVSEIIPEVLPMIGFEQHNFHHDFDVWQHTAAVVSGSEKDLILRLAAFFHDVGKPHTYTVDESGTGHFFGHAPLGAQMTETILKRMKYPSAVICEVSSIIKHHADVFVIEERPVKRLLSKFGIDGLTRLAKLRKADYLGKKKAGIENGESITEADRLIALAEEITNREECFSLKQLAVTGDDIISLGIPAGREVGILLNLALDAVIDGICDNTKTSILVYLRDKRGI